jgi:predicted metalloprotease with PDZ domain
MVLPVDWQIGTALRIHEHGFEASNYEELIDHPVVLGAFDRMTFEACGVPHTLILVGRHQANTIRFCADLQKICETQIRFFGEPAPFSQYLFIGIVTQEGYGGLEHRDSTIVMLKRDHLPHRSMAEAVMTEGYRSILGLCSHEYFHAWNIKRIKPEVFVPYRLAEEAYTRQLWIFEGFTAYYDHLMLVKAGLITPDMYLEDLSQTLSRVLNTPGRFQQTLEQASLEAWTKHYKPDENANNTSISYYEKGAWVALVLDLWLRTHTEQRCNLAIIMRILWQNYGQTGVGLPEGAFESLVETVSGCSMAEFFEQALRSTQDLPVDALLQDVGVHCALKSREDLMGIQWRMTAHEAIIGRLIENGAAQRVGLAVGDLVIACDGLRVDRGKMEAMYHYHHVGDEVLLHVFRGDVLLEFKLILQEPVISHCVLTRMAEVTPMQEERFQAWLCG